MTEMHRYPVVLGARPQQPDWFPVDAAKTLSHQDLLGLKFQELGAFWMLRLFCWKDGSVPASPKRLAVLCRSTERQMTSLLERLNHLLEPHPERPDRLIMPMVEEDRPESLRQPWAPRSTASAPEVPEVEPAESTVDDPAAEAPVPAVAEASIEVEELDDPQEIEVDEPSSAAPKDEAPPSVAVVATPPPAKVSRALPRSLTPPKTRVPSVEIDAPEPVVADSPPVEADAPVIEAEASAVESVPPAIEAKAPARDEADPPRDKGQVRSAPPLPTTPVAKLRESLPALPRPVPSGPAPSETAPPTPAPTPSGAKKESPSKEPSFFMQQESVFDAHELGLCALSEVTWQSGRLKPERHYRMKASRRRAVAAAIEKFGLEVTRLAARNLPMALHLPDEGETAGFHPLDIERAFHDPERIARFCRGSDDLLVDALRERRQALTDHAHLINQEPAPWQPPPEQVPNPQSLV